MNILKRIIDGNLAIDFGKSNKEDIYELSCIFDNEYPGVSNNRNFFYPTLISFYESYIHDDVCFFSTKSRTWDGYTSYKGAISNGYAKFMTARSIIDEYYGTQTINIDEKDIMDIIS